jgi:hypothetical protein
MHIQAKYPGFLHGLDPGGDKLIYSCIALQMLVVRDPGQETAYTFIE